MTIVYLDTETDLIGPGLLAPPLVCLQFAVDDGPVVVAVDGVDPIDELLVELLEHHVVGHNLAYDTLVQMRHHPALVAAILRAYEEDRCHCTIVREKLLHIERGTLKGKDFRLETLSKKYGGRKDSNDPWRLRYAELRGVPFHQWPQAARDYAVHDVEETRRVFNGQGPLTVSPDEYRQTRASLVMHYIGSVGIFTDQEQVDRFEATVVEQYQKDQRELALARLVSPGGSRNTKRAKARMAEVTEARGLEVAKTKKGHVSLDEEACVRSGDDLLLAYQRYGSHQSLQTRLQGLKAGYDKPINARFDSLMETGRTSCSKGRPGGPTNGYQLQNMRRVQGERECFIPEPGEVILACDWDSFEMSTLAQVCVWVLGRSSLADALRGGLDPHLLGAAKALGMSYEEAHAVYKEGDEAVALARQGFKIANFGYPGGMGEQSFVGYAAGYGMKLTVEKGRELKENWLETWEEMGAYFEWVRSHPWREVVRGDYYVKTTTVTQLPTKRVRGGCSYTVACNSFFQGLAADVAKDAGWAIMVSCLAGELHALGWRPWNFVHDEYLLRGPLETAARAAVIVQDIMESTAAAWLPDAPPGATPALMYRWSKKAKPVYKAGDLVPWEES